MYKPEVISKRDERINVMFLFIRLILFIQFEKIENIIECHTIIGEIIGILFRMQKSFEL